MFKSQFLSQGQFSEADYRNSQPVNLQKSILLDQSVQNNLLSQAPRSNNFQGRSTILLVNKSHLRNS
jgi:hypothetical protein